MAKVRKTSVVPEEASLSLEEQLQDIMKNFDFDQVCEYMNWDKSTRTYDENGNCTSKSPWFVYTGRGYKIPNVDELKQLAKRQLEDLIERHKKYPKENYLYIHCGPFKATYRHGMLVLECIIEYWSCD